MISVLAGSQPVSAETITISTNDTRQTMDGFGGAQPRYGVGSPSDAMPGDPAYDLVHHAQAGLIMDLMFSDLNGIGLSILRSKITAALEVTDGNWNYSNDADQVWIMQGASLRGPVKLLSSVWSPPGWMKNVDNIFYGSCSNNHNRRCYVDIDPTPMDADGDAGCGTGNTCIPGTLNTSAYSKFADYLVHYVRDFANTWGLKIYAVSMTNEPNAQVLWDGCAWEPDWIATFLGTHLAPAFSTAGVTTKVVGPEAPEWNHLINVGVCFNGTRIRPLCDPLYTGPNAGECDSTPHPLASSPLMGPIINNSTALARVNIVAAHSYGDNLVSALPSALAGKPAWQTEYSAFYDTWNADGAVRLATDVYNSVTSLANPSAWLWFIMFGGFPGQSGTLIAQWGSAYLPSKAFWALGNYSKFVRPGFQRIGVTSSSSHLLVTAYKEPGMGQLVVVVVNDSNSAITAYTSVTNPTSSGTATPYLTSASYDLSPLSDVSLPGNVTFPAKSVMTLVSFPPHRTSDIVWRKVSTGGDSLTPVGAVRVWLGAIPTAAHYAGALPPSEWQVKGIGQFNGNAKGDILWRATTGPNAGANAFWHDGSAGNPGYPGNLSTIWTMLAAGDFNGNGTSDILWRHNTGIVAYWKDGTNTSVSVGLRMSPWKFDGVGDFNNNGSTDILWRNTSTGAFEIWYDGTTTNSSPGALPNDWQAKGIGDFDGNGYSDILLRRTSDNLIAIWWDGTNSTAYPGYAASTLQNQGVGDFDGDGKSDILWRDASGTAIIWLAANPAWVLAPGNPGAEWQIEAVGRFD